MDWDEFPEAQAWQEDGWRVSWDWKGSDASASHKTAAGGAAEDEDVTIEDSQAMEDQTGDVEHTQGRSIRS